MSNSPAEKKPKFFFGSILDVLEVFFCTVPLALMTILICIHVIFRYVLLSPLGWSEEVTLICMIWCAFGAASYAFRKGINVGVTFLVDKIEGKSRGVIEVIIDLIVITFFAILLVASWETAMNVLGKYSNASHIPLIIPYAAIPTGCVMVILRVFQMMLEKFKRMQGGSDDAETSVDN